MESIVSSVSVLMESGVEELKVLQTILLLVTTTDVVQGRPLAKVHMYIMYTIINPQCACARGLQ